jgi:hypothetical protein
MSTYVPIKFKISAGNCPLCGAYAQFQWESPYLSRGGFIQFGHFMFGQCNHCHEFTLWRNKVMIYPLTGDVPLPNEDLPTDVKDDYEEAADILHLSPRGAVALLRLAIQKLCKFLGESGENINSDIKSLVAKGLPIVMQKALDSVRVVGNNAVHPGQIDLRDDVDTAHKLFGFINIIATTLITQPKQIAEFYQDTVPEVAKAAIAKRDGAAQ